MVIGMLNNSLGDLEKTFVEKTFLRGTLDLTEHHEIRVIKYLLQNAVISIRNLSKRQYFWFFFETELLLFYVTMALLCLSFESVTSSIRGI